MRERALAYAAVFFELVLNQALLILTFLCPPSMLAPLLALFARRLVSSPSDAALVLETQGFRIYARPARIPSFVREEWNRCIVAVDNGMVDAWSYEEGVLDSPAWLALVSPCVESYFDWQK